MHCAISANNLADLNLMNLLGSCLYHGSVITAQFSGVLFQYCA